jgi:hypothetical protein
VACSIFARPLENLLDLVLPHPMCVNMWLPGFGVEIESNLHDVESTTSKLDPGQVNTTTIE